MAELIGDVFLQILYMVYPEMPMILLVNKLARAIVPTNDVNVTAHLSTSRAFHRHNRDTFRAKVQEIYNRPLKMPSPETDLHGLTPFGHIHNCRYRWQSLLKHIGDTSGRDRVFYDNLAFRIFRHCVLASKTHLIGVIPKDIGDIAANCTLWNSFNLQSTSYVWPARGHREDGWVDPYGKDILAITVRSLPPIYMRYQVCSNYQSVHIQAEFFGSIRNSRDDDGTMSGLGRLPEVEARFPFLNSTIPCMEQQRELLLGYETTNPLSSSSIVGYRCRFVEAELRSASSPLLWFLTRNQCFVDHIKTEKELSSAITKIEYITDEETHNNLLEARNWQYTKCGCKQSTSQVM